MKKTVTIHKRSSLYQGFMRLDAFDLQHTLHTSGDLSPVLNRELLCRDDAAMILPYDAVMDRVIVVEQFRLATYISHGQADQAWPWEFPAGVIEKTDTVEATARRELFEETNLAAQKLVKLGRYFTSPGSTTETMHLFYALVDSSTLQLYNGVAYENEDIRTHCLAYNELEDALRDGRVVDASTQLLAHQFAPIRQRLRAQL